MIKKVIMAILVSMPIVGCVSSNASTEPVAVASNMTPAAVAAYGNLSNEAKMVVNQVNSAAGDFYAACEGAKAALEPRINDAVTKLARSGKISGNYNAIGNEAGSLYATGCDS